ncbi:MAG: hypothetical protein ACJAT5_000256 [Lentimonas sp.]|jgi:hypothetical protein
MWDRSSSHGSSQLFAAEEVVNEIAQSDALSDSGDADTSHVACLHTIDHETKDVLKHVRGSMPCL